MDAQSLTHLTAALEAAAATTAESDEGLWREHVAAVEAFLSVTTQFRAVAMGGGFEPSRLVTMGLDYAGVRAGLDAEGIVVTPALWRDLQVMERAAIAALNERRN